MTINDTIYMLYKFAYINFLFAWVISIPLFIFILYLSFKVNMFYVFTSCVLFSIIDVIYYHNNKGSGTHEQMFNLFVFGGVFAAIQLGLIVILFRIAFRFMMGSIERFEQKNGKIFP